MNENLKDHVRAVLDLCGDALVTVTGNGGWTCDEADALFGLLRRVGLFDLADVLLLAHAESDDEREGDRHAVADDGETVVWTADVDDCDFDYATATIGAGTYCRTHCRFHEGR